MENNNAFKFIADKALNDGFTITVIVSTTQEKGKATLIVNPDDSVWIRENIRIYEQEHKADSLA